MKRRFTLRLKLAAWYAVVLLSILAFVSGAVYTYVRNSLEVGLSEQLDRDFGVVATVVAASPVGSGSGGHLPGDVLFRVMEGSRVLYHSEAWCRAKFFDDVRAEPIRETGAWRSREGRQHRLRVRSMSLGGRQLRVTVAEDTTMQEKTLRSLRRVLLISLPVAVVLSVAGGYVLAGRALSPIATMAAKAREIGAESLSERLPVHNPADEIGRMAAVFNETLERLEQAFERLNHFTVNVSHELRTPLTAIRSVGEVALQRGSSAERLRDVIGSMLEEVTRLTVLVDAMLNVARAAPGGRGQRERVNLTSEVAAAVDLVRVLAEEKGQSVEVAAAECGEIRGDPAGLRQAVLNLVDNAIRYTPPGGRIRISLRLEENGDRLLEVEDDGPGIPDQEQLLVFERFHRASNAAGAGAGLGLAIARAAVESSGGTLEYRAVPGGGSCFRMRFPAAPQATRGSLQPN